VLERAGIKHMRFYVSVNTSRTKSVSQQNVASRQEGVRYFYLFFRNILNFFSLCDKNIFPVEPAMIMWRKFELAGLKRIEILTSSKGGSILKLN
jgi:hypothetical protein